MGIESKNIIAFHKLTLEEKTIIMRAREGKNIVIAFDDEGGFDFKVGGHIKPSQIIFAIESIKHDVLTNLKIIED